MPASTPPFPGWRLSDPARIAAFSACGTIREGSPRITGACGSLDGPPDTFPPSAAWFAAKPERMALHREATAKAKADSCGFANALRAVLARRLALGVGDPKDPKDPKDAETEAAIASMLRGAGGAQDTSIQDAVTTPAQPPAPLRRYSEGFRAPQPAPRAFDTERDQAVDAMLRGARGDEPGR